MSSRGVTGATKPRSHNVNSVYAGKNNATGRAAGPAKHGLQLLGKTSNIVRRMPKPATLPSLKSEIGVDPNVVLVPQGGQGWNKPTVDAADKSADPNNSPDLRPNWAKSAAGAAGAAQSNGQSAAAPHAETAAHAPSMTAQPQRGSKAVAANSRDFPTLQASLAAANKQTSASSQGSPEAGKASKAPSKTDSTAYAEPEPIVNVPPPPSTGSGYIGASTAPRNNVDRKIPDRYYGAPEGTKPTAQKRYDFRQKLAQLSMDSRESAANSTNNWNGAPSAAPAPPPAATTAAAAAAEPVPPEEPSVPTPAAPPPPPPQPAAMRSQDVRRLQHSHADDTPTPLAAHHPPHSANDWPNDYNNGARLDADNGPPPSHGHADSGGPYPPNYHNMRYDMAGWDQGPYHPQQQQRWGGRHRGEEEWYDDQQGPRNDGRDWGTYRGDERYDNGGHHPVGHRGNRSRQTSNSYADEYDAYAMYNDRRPKRRSENGAPDDGRYGSEYGEAAESGSVGRGGQQPPQSFRMLKRNDEKSAEYFGNRPQPVQEEQNNALSQLTRFGRPVRGTPPTTAPQNDAPNFNKFNKAPGSGKPQPASKPPKEAPAPPPENVWKKRMEEQQQRDEQERTTWQNVKQIRRFDFHFPAIEKEEEGFTEPEPRPSPPKPRQSDYSRWEEPGWGEDESRQHEESQDARKPAGRRQPKPSAGPKPRTGLDQAGPKKPLPAKPKKRSNEPSNSTISPIKLQEDNFSNMGEFHAEDYKIDDVLPPRVEPSYEEGFAAVDSQGQENRRQKRTADDNVRQLKPQRQPGKSWRDPRQKRPTEDKAEGAEPERRKPAGRGAQQGQRGARREPHAPRHDDEDAMSNGSDQRRRAPAPSNGNGRGRAKPNGSQGGGKPAAPPPGPAVRPAERQTAQSERNPTRSTGQKNVKPASLTSQNSGAFGKSSSDEPTSHNSNSSSQSSQARQPNAPRAWPHQPAAHNARDQARAAARPTNGEPRPARDGLAGVDINDASVVIIDTQQAADTFSGSESGEFEEVLSRKAKKQRQQLQQQEEERTVKERLRQEQQQQRRQRQKEEKAVKKSAKKAQEKSAKKAEQSEECNKCSDTVSPISATDSGVAAVSSTSHTSQDSVLPNGASVWNSVGILESPAPNGAGFLPAPAFPAPIARPMSKARADEAEDKEQVAFATSHRVQTPEFDFASEQIAYLSADHAELQKKVSKVKDFWPGGDVANYLENNGLLKANSAELERKLAEDVEQKPSPIGSAEETAHNKVREHQQIPVDFGGRQGSLGNLVFYNGGNTFNNLPYSLLVNSQNKAPSNPNAVVGQSFAGPRANYVEPNFFMPSANGAAQADWSNIELLGATNPLHLFGSGAQMSGGQRFAPAGPPTTTSFSRLMAQPPAMNPAVPPPSLGGLGKPGLVPFSAQLPPPPHLPPPPFMAAQNSQVDFSVPPPNVGVVGGHRHPSGGNVRGANANRNGLYNGNSFRRDPQRRPSQNGNHQTPSPAHLGQPWNPAITGVGSAFGLF